MELGKLRCCQRCCKGADTYESLELKPCIQVAVEYLNSHHKQHAISPSSFPHYAGGLQQSHWIANPTCGSSAWQTTARMLLETNPKGEAKPIDNVRHHKHWERRS